MREVGEHDHKPTRMEAQGVVEVGGKTVVHTETVPSRWQAPPGTTLLMKTLVFGPPSCGWEITLSFKPAIFPSFLCQSARPITNQLLFQPLRPSEVKTAMPATHKRLRSICRMAR